MPRLLALPLLLGVLVRHARCQPGPMHHCCRGKHVRVGLIAMTTTPWWTYHGNVTAAGGQFWSFTGFIPKMIEAVLMEMGITVEYYPLQIRGTVAHPRVDSGLYDIMLAPSMSGNGPFANEFVAPVPLFQYFNHVLLKKEQAPKSVWQVFAPFTLELWMVVVACVFAAALTITAIDVVNTGVSEFTFAKAAKFLYHAWSAMLGGDDNEWDSWPAKVLRLGLLLLVLVISATYTANLAAFLTDPLIEIKGPKDTYELQKAHVCVMFQGMPQPFLGSYVAPALTSTWSFEQRYNWCYDQLQAGTVEAIVGDGVSAHLFMLQHCGTLARAENIEYEPSTIHFILPAWDAELGRNISAALLHYTKTTDFSALKQAELRLGEGCPDGLEDPETEEIHWQSMIGLLVIFLGFLVLALLVGMLQCLVSKVGKRRRGEGGQKDADALKTVRESV